MQKIDFTLLSDGPSDKTLLPIIKWVLRRRFGAIPVNGEWANPYLSPHGTSNLADRIKCAIDFYPCDILFIHRDAESPDPERRYAEIVHSMETFRQLNGDAPSHVCIIPIRMTEAWLLIDEEAIRRAAGNPNGRIPLNLPALCEIETIPDPKQLLFSILSSASELRGRHLKRFSPEKQRYFITDYITDFQPLLQLPGFIRLVNDVAQLYSQQAGHSVT